ncbi:MAG TPA: DUF192 domain-containing protein [Rhodocyclaceae bacterium]|nr:DUF192 domain-containing protein [Rhodocyclaceae bacterium]
MKWLRQPACWIAAALALTAWQVQAQQSLELTAGIYHIRAELANTDQSRAQGLMYRKRMPANDGMLFVFDQDERYCMWMRNTLMPLSVAFLDGRGRIINIEEMLPQTENTHCAARPARFALEMNAAWFKTRGLDAGTSIAGVDQAPPAR